MNNDFEQRFWSKVDRLKEKKRFWSKVDKRGPNECWLWTASPKTKHGRFKTSKGEVILAHRWIMNDPPNKIVMHKCNNLKCVNPSHLFLDIAALKGEDHGMRKLTNDDVIAIRALSISQRSIAAIFKISQSHVSRIKLKKNWKHI